MTNTPHFVIHKEANNNNSNHNSSNNEEIDQ